MATILIVDDRPTNRELLMTLLSYVGHRTLEAEEGEQGLAIARAEKPDLIITDIVMPKMDGYEFARQVRADSSINKTQIIFYTSSYIISETRRLAEACGVSMVIGKPIEPEAFLEQIRIALDATQTPVIPPVPETFHNEHMRVLTDTLVNKVEELEAEITERKRAEQALRASEGRYRSLFEDSPIAVWEEDFSLVKHGLETLREQAITDFRSYFASHPEELLEFASKVRITDVNRAALQMYHAQSREAMLGTLKQAVTPDTLSSFLEELLGIADGRASFQWEGTDRTLTGEPIEVRVSWSVAPGHENDYSKVIVSVVDITERKQAEETIRRYASELEQKVRERTAELNRANAELEHANRAKDEFLANMSHELRTPLNSILGLSEALLEQRRGSLNEDQQKSLQIIESSGSHLLALINDILDLAKIEAGKFDYYPQAVSVDSLCKSSLSFIKEQASRKSINLIYNNETAVPELSADPRRLKQILVNLLTNAVKFTHDNGQVTLEVRSSSERELIQFSVLDTGIGIAPEDLKRLFTPFVQVDSSLNRQFEGTGLGLFLVQKLVDLHGGSLEVQSEVGTGSRFTVNLYYHQNKPEQLKELHIENDPLPAKQEEGVVFQPEGKGIASHHKILLAEDNDTNIITVGEYLESYGYQILVAHDGSEAIQMATESTPDIILMDIQMPIMSGLEAMQRLRADPRFATTPIIALTALAMVGDRERCLEAGATEYLSKPVSLKALRQMIETFLTDMK